jgi:hypothetical protein
VYQGKFKKSLREILGTTTTEIKLLHEKLKRILMGHNFRNKYIIEILKILIKDVWWSGIVFK